MKRVRAAFEALAPRARYAVVGLSVLIVAASYVALAASLDRSRSRLQENAATLRAAAQQMERHAAEIARLRAAPKPAASQQELRSVVEMEAKAGGFAQALRLDTGTADEVRVIVASIAFTDWLAWLERLQALSVRVKWCRVDALAGEGTVTVTATFVRAP